MSIRNILIGTCNVYDLETLVVAGGTVAVALTVVVGSSTADRRVVLVVRVVVLFWR